MSPVVTVHCAPPPPPPMYMFVSVLQMLYAVTGMPKTAFTIEAPRSAPSTDSATADAKAKSNGDGDDSSSSEESKEKDKDGGGLYDLKTRKKIQTFLEVSNGSVQHHLSRARSVIEHALANKAASLTYLPCLLTKALIIWLRVQVL